MNLKEIKPLDLDASDWALLGLLQNDASLSNVALAQAIHVSPPTCLRRVKRLHELGLIERQVAILNADVLAQVQGHGLTAVVEIALDRQGHEAQEAFEQQAVADPAVQQCYRVSPGPDFVLIVAVADMPAYHALGQRLFTAQANVRNVKTFFSIKRGKFHTNKPLTLEPNPASDKGDGRALHTP
jgi:DNA-binding Lrp family transcriptional regulator